MYVAGYCNGCGPNGSNAWRIEKRSLSTGALDPNFGTSGVVVSDPTINEDQLNAIAIDSTSMYVAGYCNGCGPNGDYAWRIEKRSLSTGALDPNFGTSGVVVSDPTTSTDVTRAIAIDSTSMYVAGYCTGCGPNGSRAWRIEKRSLSTGALDPNFGTSGVVVSDPTINEDQPIAIAIDSTSMYVAGYCNGCGLNGSLAWRIEKRSLSTGALDPNFGTSGVVVSDPTTSTDVANAIAIDSTSMYVAGYCTGCGPNGSSAWRIEKRSESNGQSLWQASPLANQDTPATLAAANDPFRLRMDIHIGPNSLATSSASFDLQFAQKSGTCDTSFSGENYEYITGSTTIAFHDNPFVVDGADLGTSANDPVHSNHTNRSQTYEEANPFTNSISSIASGDDGLWDFALRDNGAPSSTSYCFRAVKNKTVSAVTFSGASTSVAAQDAFPESIFFKPDGTKMFMVGSGNDKANEYTLSTPWSVATASFSASTSLATQDGGPTGVFFKPDGTKMFVAGVINDKIYEYNLSTPWSVTSASFTASTSVAGQDTTPRGIFFKPDGTKMFMVGDTNNKVYEYNLSTPWSVTSASFTASTSVAGQDTSPSGIFFKADGTKMYMVGFAANKANEYTLSTPWSVVTASFSASVLLTAQDSVLTGIFFKGDGTKMYILGSTNDKVYEYDTNILLDTYNVIPEITTAGAPSAPPRYLFKGGIQIKGGMIFK
jgi:hypothetical protein